MRILKARKRITLVLGLIGLLAGATKIGINYSWPDFHPKNNIQTVYDDAGLLTEDQAAFIQNYHAKLLEDHDIDYRVMTVATDAGFDINRLTHRMFQEKRTGSSSQSGRGFLLLIDAARDEVRLEVSAALESIYTDAFVSYIQHRQMIPFFQTGRVADGVLATTEMIVTRAQEAQGGNEFSPPMESTSTGGGAANPALIGTGEDRIFRQGPDVTASSADPMHVLEAYRRAMDDRNGNPKLSIYTGDTQAMLVKWTLTPAQMDNEARILKRCQPGTPAIADRYAVIRFSAKERQCPPYFFKSEHGAWKLDLTIMQKAIRFNYRNQWHFDLNYDPLSEPYGFAFAGWRLDKHGFPHE